MPPVLNCLYTVVCIDGYSKGVDMAFLILLNPLYAKSQGQKKTKLKLKTHLLEKRKTEGKKKSGIHRLFDGGFFFWIDH